MYIAFIAIGALAIIIPTLVMYVKIQNKGMVRLSIIPKATGSFMFVWLGIMAFIHGGENPLTSTLVWFLIFSLLADIAIEIKFEAGMLLFAFAHISLIYWSVSHAGFSWISVVVWAVIMAVIAFGQRKQLKEQGKKSIMVVCYAAILVADFATTIPLVSLGAAYLFMPIGLLVFLVSDYVIGLQIAGEKPWHKWVIMSLYWACLLMVSVTAWLV